MKIAYVTSYNSSDMHAWSGLGYYICRSLRDSGFQIDTVETTGTPYSIMSTVKRLLYRTISSKKYRNDRSPALLKHYSAQIEKTLKSLECDIVFSPGTIPIAYFETDKPVVFWADATFAGMVDFYPDFTNLCAESIRNGNEMEQSALSRCKLAIYSSEWAANSAIQNYDVSSEKVRVVPFGANIECDRRLEDIAQIAARRAFNVIKLLFVGVDWFRKGGDIALSVAALLNRHGIKTELNIVGCEPPCNVPDFVKLYGFVSKTTIQGRRILNNLFAESHFLILPSRAECFGVALAEASSFGLPCLATDVGGVSTAVKNGFNGKLFRVGENPESYCEYILSLISSKPEYEKLALSSFREYSNRLNWSSAGKIVHELIDEFCSSKETNPARDHSPLPYVQSRTR
jgi:glycosyltransferase involved in cell wall biosynthesis